MGMDYSIASNDNLSKLTRTRGIESWNKLMTYVERLPYGRNANREDLGLVLTENRGTCSSKHAFLKRIADKNNVPNVKLLIGIYRMTMENTPNIGNELSMYAIDYIPEAHCYLRINGIRRDVTTTYSDFQKIENDIIQEIMISPEQVAEYKVKYHQQFVRKWILETNQVYDFDTIWKIREQCIENLGT